MKEIQIKDFDENIFELIDKDWLIINSYSEEKVNSMTASWAGMGILWNKNVAYLFVRPQRYTQELLKNNEYFSISVFDEKYRDELNYLGRASGRNENKLEKVGFTVKWDENKAPMIKEARFNIMVKKLYCQQMVAESFIDKSLIEKNYPENDFHYMYVVEILKILEV